MNLDGTMKYTLRLDDGVTEQGVQKIKEWTFDSLNTQSSSWDWMKNLATAFERLSKYKVISKKKANIAATHQGGITNTVGENFWGSKRP